MSKASMGISRRGLLHGSLLGAGLVGLRAFATGLPKTWLLGERTAYAAEPTPQFLILATSGQGDPLNVNVPGSYVAGAQNSPLRRSSRAVRLLAPRPSGAPLASCLDVSGSGMHTATERLRKGAGT